jgi:uncharacterized protein (TIGR02145 family)
MRNTKLLFSFCLLWVGIITQAQVMLPPFQGVYVKPKSLSCPLDEVTIGTQKWKVKNLDVTTYRNGDIIPQVTDPTAWINLTTGAWCYYDNNAANGSIFGKLYNWYAVNDPRGLAPVGWHVPSDDEWATLKTTLGGAANASNPNYTLVAGGKMKTKGTTIWASPNVGATNESCFSALPGGMRYVDGSFLDGFNYGDWWSTTDYSYNNNSAMTYYLAYNDDKLWRTYNEKWQGFSVRCVEDNISNSGF